MSERAGGRAGERASETEGEGGRKGDSIVNLGPDLTHTVRAMTLPTIATAGDHHQGLQYSQSMISVHITTLACRWGLQVAKHILG